jgi:hypothetical protein
MADFFISILIQCSDEEKRDEKENIEQKGTKIRGTTAPLSSIYGMGAKSVINPDEIWISCLRCKSYNFAFLALCVITKYNEYCMIYRGPGFLAVVLFSFFPIPFTPAASPVSKCSCVSPASLLPEEGWGGAK